jgi:hypothetical protein
MITMRELREFVNQNHHISDDCALYVFETDPSPDFDNSGLEVSAFVHDKSLAQDDQGIIMIMAKGVDNRSNS